MPKGSQVHQNGPPSREDRRRQKATKDVRGVQDTRLLRRQKHAAGVGGSKFMYTGLFVGACVTILVCFLVVALGKKAGQVTVCTESPKCAGGEVCDVSDPAAGFCTAATTYYAAKIKQEKFSAYYEAGAAGAQAAADSLVARGLATNLDAPHAVAVHLAVLTAVASKASKAKPENCPFCEYPLPETVTGTLVMDKVGIAPYMAQPETEDALVDILASTAVVDPSFITIKGRSESATADGRQLRRSGAGRRLSTQLTISFTIATNSTVTSTGSGAAITYSRSTDRSADAIAAALTNANKESFHQQFLDRCGALSVDAATVSTFAGADLAGLGGTVAAESLDGFINEMEATAAVVSSDAIRSQEEAAAAATEAARQQVVLVADKLTILQSNNVTFAGGQSGAWLCYRSSTAAIPEAYKPSCAAAGTSGEGEIVPAITSTGPLAGRSSDVQQCTPVDEWNIRWTDVEQTHLSVIHCVTAVDVKSTAKPYELKLAPSVHVVAAQDAGNNLIRELPQGTGRAIKFMVGGTTPPAGWMCYRSGPAAVPTEAACGLEGTATTISHATSGSGPECTGMEQPPFSPVALTWADDSGSSQQQMHLSIIFCTSATDTISKPQAFEFKQPVTLVVADPAPVAHEVTLNPGASVRIGQTATGTWICYKTSTSDEYVAADCGAASENAAGTWQITAAGSGAGSVCTAVSTGDSDYMVVWADITQAYINLIHCSSATDVVSEQPFSTNYPAPSGGGFLKFGLKITPIAVTLQPVPAAVWTPDTAAGKKIVMAASGTAELAFTGGAGSSYICFKADTSVVGAAVTCGAAAVPDGDGNVVPVSITADTARACTHGGVFAAVWAAPAYTHLSVIHCIAADDVVSTAAAYVLSPALTQGRLTIPNDESVAFAGGYTAGNAWMCFESSACEPSAAAQAFAGDGSTVTLAATAGAGSCYGSQTISLLTGAGAGQSRTVAAYDGTTKVATLDAAFSPPGAAGDAYSISMGVVCGAEEGTATATARIGTTENNLVCTNGQGSMGFKLLWQASATAQNHLEIRHCLDAADTTGTPQTYAISRT